MALNRPAKYSSEINFLQYLRLRLYVYVSTFDTYLIQPGATTVLLGLERRTAVWQPHCCRNHSFCPRGDPNPPPPPPAQPPQRRRSPCLTGKVPRLRRPQPSTRRRGGNTWFHPTCQATPMYICIRVSENRNPRALAHGVIGGLRLSSVEGEERVYVCTRGTNFRN